MTDVLTFVILIWYDWLLNISVSCVVTCVTHLVKYLFAEFSLASHGILSCAHAHHIDASHVMHHITHHMHMVT